MKEQSNMQNSPKVHRDIAGVLGEFKEVMLPKLSKKLLPRLIHLIELKLGAKVLAMGPYCMAPPKSEELGR
ncbi:hypothetical protein Nepgr_005196 [Nepenthes gracilis]|uniref:Uncharacterized protein n=1 Tax=Nepenthes gracilis TaxID=150966 RepID=A0AAD3XG71_NEPGR|nr:hypothetical protein Nepgr_005196 [Nepenthes gracilis]